MKTMLEGFLGGQNQVVVNLAYCPVTVKHLLAGKLLYNSVPRSLILHLGLSAPCLQTSWCVHSRLLLIAASFVLL